MKHVTKSTPKSNNDKIGGIKQKPNNLIKKKEENISQKAVSDEVELLTNNPYWIPDMNGIVEQITEPCCPIVYMDNAVIAAPSPHDMALSDVANSISDFIAFPIPDMKTDRGGYINYIKKSWDLRSTATSVLTNMYVSTILSICESYIDNNIRRKFNAEYEGSPYKYNVDVFVDNILCANDFTDKLENIICRMFSSWWTIMNSDEYNEETKNHINTTTLYSALTSIYTELSSNLCRFARQTSFCEPLGFAYYNIAPSVQERDNYLEIISDDSRYPITPNEFYVSQMYEYTRMAAGLSQLIEIALYQAVNSFNYVCFPSRNYGDIPYDDGDEMF